ncbi:subtilisin-like protease sbt4.2 [Quercus suber]|uniref:Subtilisin-like protease sbt4.2 n=1 Tax=Quercus suber TaxID=58331 RepID=A0AAW0L9R3_QUESU
MDPKEHEEDKEFAYGSGLLNLAKAVDPGLVTRVFVKAPKLAGDGFSLAIEDGDKISGIFTGRVTNVGSANSTYYAKIDKPDFLNIAVEPSVLSFFALGEEKSLCEG